MSRNRRPRIARGTRKYIRRLKREYRVEERPEITLRIEEAYRKYEEKHDLLDEDTLSGDKD